MFCSRQIILVARLNTFEVFPNIYVGHPFIPSFDVTESLNIMKLHGHFNFPLWSFKIVFALCALCSLLILSFVELGNITVLSSVFYYED